MFEEELDEQGSEEEEEEGDADMGTGMSLQSRNSALANFGM